MITALIAYLVACTINSNVPNSQTIQLVTPSHNTCNIDLTEQIPDQCNTEPTKADKDYIIYVLWWLGTFKHYDYLANTTIDQETSDVLQELCILQGLDY